MLGSTPPMLFWVTQGDIYTTSWSTQLLMAVNLKQRSFWSLFCWDEVSFFALFRELQGYIVLAHLLFHHRGLFVSHTFYLSNKSPDANTEHQNHFRTDSPESLRLWLCSDTPLDLRIPGTKWQEQMWFCSLLLHTWGAAVLLPPANGPWPTFHFQA